MRLSEEQGFRHEAVRQTFRGGAGWGNYGVGDGGAWIEFADRMGRLREELAIGLSIGKWGTAGRGWNLRTEWGG